MALIKVCIQKMKEYVELTKESPRNVVHHVLKGANMEILEAMGNFDSIYRTLRNFRSSLLNPKPFLYPSINLSSNLCTTHLNERFYQYGEENFGKYFVDENIMIFFSETMAYQLKCNNILSIDGTFKVVPTPYCQLFTISFLKNAHVFPVVFAILKNKRKETYENLFKLLNTMIGPLNPRIIKTDFEYASILAVKNIFPNVIISGCQFHLGQAIIRKVNDAGLKISYQNSHQTKKFIKSLLCLPYVKFEKILETFNEIRQHNLFPDPLSNIYDYFFF